MAKLKQDFEVILDSIVSLLQSKLNTKLSSITTEKNDTVVLPSIDNLAYFRLTLDIKNVNYDPFVFIGVSDIKSQGQRGLTSHSASVFILAVKADEGDNLMIDRTLLRYMRALEEVFEDNFDDLATGTSYIIESLAPRTLADLNTNKQFRGAGVGLTFQYA